MTERVNQDFILRLHKKNWRSINRLNSLRGHYLFEDNLFLPEPEYFCYLGIIKAML